jgi:protein-disulfide isomerase
MIAVNLPSGVDPNAFYNANGPSVYGNKDGNIVLVEFFDYQCGTCRQFASQIQALTQSNSNLKILFVDVNALGQNSELAARAALAAGQEGKYMAMHDALLSSKKPLNTQQIFTISKQIGLDASKIASSMNSSKVNDLLDANMALYDQFGFPGVPAFVLGNKNIPGKWYATLGLNNINKLQQGIQQVSGN